MTQEQRADVWARRDQLTAQLTIAKAEDPATDPEKASDTVKALRAGIEACNTELTSNTYNPPVVETDNHL